MNIVIAFHCAEGAVVATDSMISQPIGGLSVGHHHGVKVYVLLGSQVFAFAGDQGQAAELNHNMPSTVAHPLDYLLALAQGLSAQFQNTGIGASIDVILFGFPASAYLPVLCFRDAA